MLLASGSSPVRCRMYDCILDSPERVFGQINMKTKAGKYREGVVGEPLTRTWVLTEDFSRATR